MLYNYLNFKISISFNRLVLGYNIFDREYFDVNYILTIIGYSIYKSTNHMFRNKKTKSDRCIHIICKRTTTWLNICTNIYSTVLFNKIQHVLKNNYEKYMIYVL